MKKDYPIDFAAFTISILWAADLENFGYFVTCRARVHNSDKDCIVSMRTFDHEMQEKVDNRHKKNEK